MTRQTEFPGSSKKRVSSAGQRLRTSNETSDDIATIEQWRAAHSIILNNFSTILRYKIKGKGISKAQRLKRFRTLKDKLTRFPKMQLARMDDIAGCRLIFEEIESLRRFRSELHAAKFNHKLRNNEQLNKYDYIEFPKRTGYRLSLIHI